jgi:hypothetical protein
MLLLTHGRGRRLPHPEHQIHWLIVHDEARSLVAVSASPLSPASRRPILQTRSSLGSQGRWHADRCSHPRAPRCRCGAFAQHVRQGGTCG